jgi:uncharacterized protein
MKVKVSDIPDEGLEIEERASLKINGECVPAEVRLRLDRKGTEVFVDGTVGAEPRLTCGRCLNSFARKMDVPVSLVYRPVEELAEETRELEAEELETGFYRADELDIDSLAAEQLILSMPIKVLCDEACKGICPRCGADLNRQTCSCPAGPEPGESKFADLKKFMKERSE